MRVRKIDQAGDRVQGYAMPMRPIDRAVWYVECHLREALTLGQVARRSGLSPSHLTRAFAAMVGCSLMRYIRKRRLADAAHQLGQGSSAIISVALDSGYQSHEAFTRAFRGEFGVTPQTVKKGLLSRGLPLKEPIPMSETPVATLAEPRIVTGKAMTIAGIAREYVCGDVAGIPGQWMEFLPHIGHVAGEVQGAAYGVCTSRGAGWSLEYLTGVEVAGRSELPAGFKAIKLGSAQYAVFHQPGHISLIRGTMAYIFGTAMPTLGREPADAPLLERYGSDFDPETGEGGYEIWVPLVR